MPSRVAASAIVRTLTPRQPGSSRRGGGRRTLRRSSLGRLSIAEQGDHPVGEDCAYLELPAERRDVLAQGGQVDVLGALNLRHVRLAGTTTTARTARSRWLSRMTQRASRQQRRMDGRLMMNRTGSVTGALKTTENASSGGSLSGCRPISRILARVVIRRR